MIVIRNQAQNGLIEIVEITLNKANHTQLLIWPGAKVVGCYASSQRAREVLEQVRQAISRGDRTYELPEA